MKYTVTRQSFEQVNSYIMLVKMWRAQFTLHYNNQTTQKAKRPIPRPTLVKGHFLGFARKLQKQMLEPALVKCKYIPTNCTVLYNVPS